LAYISIENLKAAIGADAGFCDACFTGNYPTPVPASAMTPVEIGRRERDAVAPAYQGALPGV
jgi:glutamine phosphoribosylpyrophosphate amidotransferase